MVRQVNYDSKATQCISYEGLLVLTGCHLKFAYSQSGGLSLASLQEKVGRLELASEDHSWDGLDLQPEIVAVDAGRRCALLKPGVASEASTNKLGCCQGSDLNQRHESSYDLHTTAMLKILNSSLNGNKSTAQILPSAQIVGSQNGQTSPCLLESKKSMNQSSRG